MVNRTGLSRVFIFALALAANGCALAEDDSSSDIVENTQSVETAPARAVPLQVMLNAGDQIASELVAVRKNALKRPARNAVELSLDEIINGERFPLADQTVVLSDVVVIDPDLSNREALVAVLWDPPTAVVAADSEIFACARLLKLTGNGWQPNGSWACDELIPQL